MKYAFVGDCMVQQPFNLDYLKSDELKDYIDAADFKFFNLETTINDLGQCFASQFSGGSYLRADKKCIDSVLKFPFNITSFNNNHAFDFGMDGFISTMKSLKDANIPFAGTGYDLSDASKPVFLEKNGNISALISICSTFNNSMMAGEQSPYFKGRPGVNGIHIKKKLIVTKEQMNMFIKTADDTGINAIDDNDRKDGYLPPLNKNEFSFGGLMMEIGEKPEYILYLDENDKSRIKETILKAKKTANEIVISYHTHEQIDSDIAEIPKFQEEFCRFLIECGADIVVCHGPHLLRGIEIYKNRPIFYSIGNFIMQLNCIPEAPADFYSKYNVNPNEGVKKLLDVRSNYGKRGLMYNGVMFEAIIPFVNIENGVLKEVKLLPIELGFNDKLFDVNRGLPRVAVNTDFMNRLSKLSEKYDTKISNKNGQFFVEVK